MAQLWHESRLLIDGELCEADGGRTYPVVNPATEEEFARAAGVGRDPRTAQTEIFSAHAK